MSEEAEYDFEPRELGAVETIRHSMAHLMASAVEQLFPGTRFGVGPHVEHGFYYDMDVTGTISEDDLQRIETTMRKIAKKNHRFEQTTMSSKEALQWADESGQRIPGLCSKCFTLPSNS